MIKSKSCVAYDNLDIQSFKSNISEIWAQNLHQRRHSSNQSDNGTLDLISTESEAHTAFKTTKTNDGTKIALMNLLSQKDTSMTELRTYKKSHL